jgi:UDP:flavonoid glycosyltransferase YjiC (YdhE family)
MILLGFRGWYDFTVTYTLNILLRSMGSTTFGSTVGMTHRIISSKYLLSSFAGTGWEVVVSTGGQPVPRRWRRGGNLRVFPWVPGAAMVARADGILFHGGYGTMMETVRAGVPSVVLPFHTEQEGNGRRLQHCGAARVLAPEDGDLESLESRWGGGQFVAMVCRHLPFQPHQVREAVSAILGDKPYRASAARLRRSQAAYGGAALAAELLAELGIR